MQQSHLKVEADGTVVRLDPPPPPPPTTSSATEVPLGCSADQMVIFMADVRAASAKIYHRIDDMVDEMKFFRELVFGSRTSVFNPGQVCSLQMCLQFVIFKGL